MEFEIEQVHLSLTTPIVFLKRRSHWARDHNGKKVLIPCMIFKLPEEEIKFHMERWQFPVWLVFSMQSMTINKSQGQSIKNVHLDAATQNWPYVKTRCLKSSQHSSEHIKGPFHEGSECSVTISIVYKNVLLEESNVYTYIMYTSGVGIIIHILYPTCEIFKSKCNMKKNAFLSMHVREYYHRPLHWTGPIVWSLVISHSILVRFSQTLQDHSLYCYANIFQVFLSLWNTWLWRLKKQKNWPVVMLAECAVSEIDLSQPQWRKDRW